jgi:hypothetical protein
VDFNHRSRRPVLQLGGGRSPAVADRGDPVLDVNGSVKDVIHVVQPVLLVPQDERAVLLDPYPGPANRLSVMMAWTGGRIVTVG